MSLKKNKIPQRSHSISQTKSVGDTRILAGKWRGKKLPFNHSDGLRPTLARAKETLFNWLMPYLSTAVALDCFAGSGSLGFELLSRGGVSCTMLEKNPKTVRQLQQLQQQMQINQLIVQQTDTLQWLSQPAITSFNMIFIDPPFHQNLITSTCQQLVQQGYCTPGALISIELESHAPYPTFPKSWRLLKQKQFGQSILFLLQHNEATTTA